MGAMTFDQIIDALETKQIVVPKQQQDGDELSVNERIAKLELQVSQLIVILQHITGKEIPTIINKG